MSRSTAPGFLPPADLLGLYVQPVTYAAAVARIMDWSAAPRGHTVCCANVHMVMEAHDDPALQRIINDADLVVPDGMPLVWLLRGLGHVLPDRVYGPTLTLRLLAAAETAGLPVGFYGATPQTLQRLLGAVRGKYPRLAVPYAVSPPFRPLELEEDEAVVAAMNASGARFIFVGLGCPRQELWLAAHRARVGAVLLGVGAAFDFLAGTTRQAPAWMQDRGLEWLFRLAVEPRRLWRRYLLHNPRFVVLALRRLLRHRLAR